MLAELFNEKVLVVNSTPSGPGLGICRPSAGSAGQSEIRAEPEAVTGSLSNASPDCQSVIETTYSGSSKKASASIVACWSCSRNSAPLTRQPGKCQSNDEQRNGSTSGKRLLTGTMLG